MKIVCFGDSVTRGISYVNGRLRIVKENYPVLLQKLFGNEQELEVVNKGVFNDNSDLLLERLEQDVLSQHPDYVLIGVGGNDCNFRWDEVAAAPEESHEPIVDVQRYLQNVKQMATRIQSAGAIPIFLSLIPLDPVRYYRFLLELHGKNIAHWIALCGGIEHWHAGYSKALKNLLASLELPSIDVRAAFAKWPTLATLISDDGIHPTSEGYRLMSETIFQTFSGLRLELK
ncbi:MAG: SGNH/GDSL hydrolase family protein [Tumebacillaceae bacterium]